MNDIEIEWRPIGSVEPNPRNPRTHSRQQVRLIADSIRQFGFVNPILIDEADRIIAGHARREAAERAGFETVPVIRLSHLTEHQKRALALADNKIALNAGWNAELLAQELQILSEVEIDFDVSITGFETAEIDLLIEGLNSGETDARADALPEPLPEDEVTVRRGDLWLLEPHRLLCGNALNTADFDRLMAGQAAQMVFTDPPYNVPIDGHVSGLGAIRHRDFAMASGEMSEAQFTAFLGCALANLVAHCLDGSIHFVCIDWRHIGELSAAGRETYTELKNLCVWNKTNAGMGSFYRSKHELVFVFKNGRAPHINNIELGRHGRNRTNVWEYAGVNALRPDRLDELKMHPTVKPVDLVADAIMDCSKRGGIVLDCFAGSGTTIIAAQRTGRRAYAMEIDPGYVETAVRRWQAYTGEHAIHAETGRRFAEIQSARAAGREGSANLDHGNGSPGSFVSLRESTEATDV